MENCIEDTNRKFRHASNKDKQVFYKRECHSSFVGMTDFEVSTLVNTSSFLQNREIELLEVRSKLIH